MSVELITAAQILAGTGAAGWTASKLLGPSADALGDHIRVYLSSRITRIFERVESKSQDVELGYLPPGFAVDAIRKASISEDDEKLTEMWANLLISAATEYETRHSVFADILSQIGPKEARLMDEIFLGKDMNGAGNLSNIDINFRLALDKLDIGGTLSRARANEILEPVIERFKTLPAIFESVEIVVGGSDSSTSGLYEKGNSLSCLVLERQNLLKSRSFGYPKRAYGGPLVTIDAFVPTDLGVEFLEVCSKK